MKQLIKIIFFSLTFIFIIYIHDSFAMLNRLRQALTKQNTLPQRRTIVTHQTPKNISSTSEKSKISPTFLNTIKSNVSVAKTAFWNLFSYYSSAPSQSTPQSIQYTTPLTSIHGKSVSVAPSSIDTALDLSQAKNFLQNSEKTELNKQKEVLHISTPQWQSMIEKINKHIRWMSDNCFKINNPATSWDKDIPIQVYDRIIFFLNKVGINPTSINVRYQNTTHHDPFGHTVVSVVGPSLRYSLTDKNNISGFEPAILLLHRQIVETLSSDALDAELQHAITHFTQGHNEQLKILQEEIGEEKYKQFLQSSDGQTLLASLETTADFLMSAQDADVAKIVYKTFFEKAFQQALNAIKKNRKDLGIENKETGLMICTAPGIQELEFLSTLQSFDDIENYFISVRRRILRSKGLDEDEIQELEQDIKRSKKETLERCKNPIAGATHDTTLAPEILAEIKRLLIQAGINPLAVTIENRTKKEMNNSFALAHSSFKHRSFNKDEPAKLVFSQELISQTPIEETIFSIAHEIGHLLRNHTNNYRIIYSKAENAFFRKRKIIKPFVMPGEDIIMDPDDYREWQQFKKGFEQKFYDQISAMDELEADTTYLMKDINIAKIAQRYAISLISSGQKNTVKDISAIHMSVNKKFHWARKILQLHQKEALKTQESFFETTKE